MHNWFVGTVATLWRGAEGPLKERVEEILRLLQEGAVASGPFSEASSFGFYSSEVRAERVDGGYRVNGRKIFWSNQPGTTLLTTSAERDEQTLLMFLGPLAETTGVRPLNDWDTLGMRATASNSAVFEDAFFPEKWIWELPNHFYGGPISAVGGTWFAAGVAATYAGIAQAARDYAVDWVKSGRSKFPFPSGKQPEPLAHMPHAQALVTEMDVLLQAMDGMLRTCNRDREADPAWNEATMIEAWRTKHFVTSSAVQVVEKALSLVGGAGYFRKGPLERWYRSVRAGEFHPLNWGDLCAYAGKMAFGLDPHVEPRYV
jgi:alkylation response protein AidB-like acyl-CoA dehydrogenase